MHPSQVLDSQVDLTYRLQNDPLFRGYVMQCWLQDSFNPESIPMAKQQELIDAMALRIQTAYAYHVTVDMCSLVAAGAQSFADDDVMDHRVAPTLTGFARFDAPIMLMDARGMTLKVHWIVWGGVNSKSGETGMVIWGFNDSVNEPDDMAKGIVKELMELPPDKQHFTADAMAIAQPWGWVGSVFMMDGHPVGPQELTVEAEQSPLRGKKFTNLKRFMLSFWEMLNQTITITEDAKLERHSAKRARRAGIPDRVTVVDLRRVERPQSDGETNVEWSHRWVVRGHWRNQPCGEGRREYKRIWIHDHVKGPDDKPLIITEKVYNLRR